MISPKKCIDATMTKIIKQISLPNSIKNHISLQTERVGSDLCYCVILDNVVVSAIPIERFYTQLFVIIQKRVEHDIEQHVAKVYAKELNSQEGV